MTSYKNLNTVVYKKNSVPVTPDSVYWKKYAAPVLIKEFGPVDHINFSPIEPYHFVVTCSVRVQVYNPITKLVVKKFTQFRENAYGAVFRHDGRLICAGDNEGKVKLFDVSSKNLLRVFQGHSAPVHRTLFATDKPHIVSFSDDKSVKQWDIPTEKCLSTHIEHSYYVRAGAINPVMSELILSGAYNGVVKLYDTKSENVVLSADHGSPVESVLFLPSGGIFLSAGGTDIKIWDARNGNRPLGQISQHHKTITCLALGSDNKRLLSGGLDRHVKVYDVSTFQVVHTINYPNSVLSLGISKNDDTVVAGLIDGLISVSRKEEKTKPETKVKKKQPNQRYFSESKPIDVDLSVPDRQVVAESRYDTHLRKFEYAKALECVLMPHIISKKPHITTSMLQELARRNALPRLFSTMDAHLTNQLLSFIVKYITLAKHTRVLTHVAEVFLDCYEQVAEPLSDKSIFALKRLQYILQNEAELTNELLGLQGAMEMLISATSSESLGATSETQLENGLTPSAGAKEDLIFDVL